MHVCVRMYVFVRCERVGFINDLLKDDCMLRGSTRWFGKTRTLLSIHAIHQTSCTTDRNPSSWNRLPLLLIAASSSHRHGRNCGPAKIPTSETSKKHCSEFHVPDGDESRRGCKAAINLSLLSNCHAKVVAIRLRRWLLPQPLSPEHPARAHRVRALPSHSHACVLVRPVTDDDANRRGRRSSGNNGGGAERAGAGVLAGRAPVRVRAARARAAARHHVPRGRAAADPRGRHVLAGRRAPHGGGRGGVGHLPGGGPRRAGRGRGGAAARGARLLRAAAGGEAAVRHGPGRGQDRGLRLHAAEARPRGQEGLGRLPLPQRRAAGRRGPRRLAGEPQGLQGGQRGLLRPHGAAHAGAVRAPLGGAGAGGARHGGGVRRRRRGAPPEDQLLPAVPAAGARARPRAAHRPKHAHRALAQRGAGPPGVQGRLLVRRRVRVRRPHHPHRRPDRDHEQREVQGRAAPDDGEPGEDADVVAGVRGAAAGARRRSAPAARHRRVPGQVQGQEVQGLQVLQDQQATTVAKSFERDL